jgi:hypothetical protein
VVEDIGLREDLQAEAREREEAVEIKGQEPVKEQAKELAQDLPTHLNTKIIREAILRRVEYKDGAKL